MPRGGAWNCTLATRDSRHATMAADDDEHFIDYGSESEAAEPEVVVKPATTADDDDGVPSLVMSPWPAVGLAPRALTSYTLDLDLHAVLPDVVDSFRSAIPDDDFVDGEALGRAYDDARVVPTSAHKATILNDMAALDLSESDVGLISSLPDAVARATLDEYRKASAREPAASTPPPAAAAAAVEPAAKPPSPSNPPSLPSEEASALRERVRHLEAKIEELALARVPKDGSGSDAKANEKNEDDDNDDDDNDDEEERDNARRLIAASKGAIEELREENAALRRGMQDLATEARTSARKAANLEADVDALRSENARLDGLLQREADRSRDLLGELRRLSQSQADGAAVSQTLQAKYAKAESRMEALKQMVCDKNAHNHEQSVVIDSLSKSNKALQSQVVHLKLECANHNEALRRLAQEVKALEANAGRDASAGKPAPRTAPHEARVHLGDQTNVVAGAGGASGPRAAHPSSLDEEKVGPLREVGVAKPSACPFAVEDGGASQTKLAMEEQERALMNLNYEKQYLESQYAKMPSSYGKTILQRKQKLYIEDRLGQLDKEISACRMAIKRTQAA